MKNKVLKTILSFAVMLNFILSVNIYANDGEKFELSVVDYNIDINDTSKTRLLKNPLLSHNDTTYVSIRDVARMLDMKVEWLENSKTISLVSIEKEDIINEPETALAIGKAVISERYKDRLTKTTQYYVTGKCEYDCSYSRAFYEVFVKFECKRGYSFTSDMEKIKDYNEKKALCDIFVRIYADNGEFTIIEK